MTQCASCTMPLDPKTTSKFDPTTCIYCQDQTTGAYKTYEEVREGCIGAAAAMGKTPEEAAKWADEVLPKLPKWAKKSA